MRFRTLAARRSARSVVAAVVLAVVASPVLPWGPAPLAVAAEEVVVATAESAAPVETAHTTEAAAPSPLPSAEPVPDATAAPSTDARNTPTTDATAAPAPATTDQGPVAPTPTPTRAALTGFGTMAAGPESGISGPSIYWNLKDSTGALVGGATFTVKRASGQSNQWGAATTVVDCTAPGCPGPDLDPDAGEFQTLAPGNDSYLVELRTAPAGYTKRDERSASARPESRPVDLGSFVVVANRALACTAGTFYSLLSDGTVRQASGRGPGATVITLGEWSDVSAGSVNALGIGMDGRDMYALERTTSTVERVLHYSPSQGWRTASDRDYAPLGLGSIVAGAVSPHDGRYYFGGFTTVGGSQQFRLHRFDPASGASSFVGSVDTALNASNGDMAFDRAGSLTVVQAQSDGNRVSAFTVPAAALAGATGASLTHSGFIAGQLQGASGVNGVAFDADGSLVLGTSTGASRFDPSTWAAEGEVTNALRAGTADSVDLASCVTPPTLTVRAVVPGRVAPADEFRVQLSTGTVVLASTTTATTADPIGPLPVRATRVYAIERTALVGNDADYATTIACSSGTANVPVTATAAGGSVTMPTAAVDCVVTFTPLVTTVTVRKTVQDADGTNPRPGIGWTITAAPTSTDGSVTGGGNKLTGADGSATWSLRHAALTSVASILISETQQTGHDFASGSCTVTPRVGAATVVTLPNATDGVLQNVQPGSAIVCAIVNRERPTTLTLFAQVDFGDAPVASWQLAASGPQGALAGPSGTSGVSGPITAATSYRLASPIGPATYTQLGAWSCKNQSDASIPVSALGDVTVALGDQVACTVAVATAKLVVLQRIVGSSSLTPGQFALTATPAEFAGLAPSTVTGADAVTTASTTIVRPGHAYTLTSASDALHIAGELERYLGTVQPGVAIDNANPDLWESVEAASIAVGPGQTAVYRFTATTPTPLTLPLTGGVGADAYLFGGSALLLLAALLLIRSRMRRPKALLMTNPDRITPQRSLASLQEGTATMASTKKSMTARVAAGFGAVAIATVTVLGGALPASAAGPNVETDRQGSITIHKYAEPTVATGLDNDGVALDAVELSGLTPLAGVGFRAQLVPGTDLTTTEGWELAAELEAANDTAAVQAAQQRIRDAGATLTREGTTAALTSATPGQLQLTALPLGVYLVTETSPGDNRIAIESAPFLVSVPMAHPDSAEWLYDVQVYPKNSLTTISKVVDDADAFGLGDEVSWTISVDVPEVAENDTLDTFVITDTLDARLGYVGSTVAATAAATTPGEREVIALVENTHYTVTGGAAFAVSFTEDGRNLLAARNAVEVTVEVVTTVDALEGDAAAQTEDGIIHNAATVSFNDASFAAKTPTPTSWGTLTIRKHETGASTVALSGATFQVFRSAKDAAARENPIAVDGEVEDQIDFESNSDGIAFVPGLKAGTYWIVETVAPLGYSAGTTPIEVIVTAGDLSQASIEKQVGNDKIAAYALPITGGSGQAAFMIGGFGLLAGAMGFALLRRRKAEQDA